MIRPPALSFIRHREDPRSRRTQVTERKIEIGKIEYLQKTSKQAKPSEPALAAEAAKAKDDTQVKDKTPALATLAPSQDATVARIGEVLQMDRRDQRETR